MSHTTGPWAFREGKQERAAMSTVFKRGDETMLVAYVICDHRNEFQRAEDIANGRLIAAAPELLAAAESALETLSLASEFLSNSTPINNGSDLHTDIVAHRERLKNAIATAVKGGA